MVRPVDFDEQTQVRLKLNEISVGWASTLVLVGDQDLAEIVDDMSDDEVEIGEAENPDMGRCGRRTSS
jgi:hypothetical protein